MLGLPGGTSTLRLLPHQLRRRTDGIENGHEIHPGDFDAVHGLLHQSDVLLDLLDRDIIDLWGVKNEKYLKNKSDVGG